MTKTHAIERLDDTDALLITLSFLIAHIEETQRNLGLDPFDLANLDRTTFEAIASGLIGLDRYPVEVLPGYWVISGVIPYDGEVAVAAVDFNSPGPPMPEPSR